MHALIPSQSTLELEGANYRSSFTSSIRQKRSQSASAMTTPAGENTYQLHRFRAMHPCMHANLHLLHAYK